MTKQEYKNAVEKLNLWAKHYYELDNPIASDSEYDALYKQVEAYERAHPNDIESNSPTRKVGGEVLKDFSKNAHKKRMWSLEDVFDESDLKAWMDKLQNALKKLDSKEITESRFNAIDSKTAESRFNSLDSKYFMESKTQDFKHNKDSLKNKETTLFSNKQDSKDFMESKSEDSKNIESSFKKDSKNIDLIESKANIFENKTQDSKRNMESRFNKNSENIESKMQDSKKTTESSLFSSDKSQNIAQDSININNLRFCISPKYDGMSLNLYYKNGELVSATTRGDGEVGELVTQNARMIESIPQRIPFKGEIEIRGEVVMRKEIFEMLNKERGERGEPLFANPRNAASGSMRQLDSNLVKERKLDFIPWGIGFCSDLESLKNMAKDRI